MSPTDFTDHVPPHTDRTGRDGTGSDSSGAVPRSSPAPLGLTADGTGVSRWVAHHARERPDEIALICPTSAAGLRNRVTFSELESVTASTARALTAAGIAKGDRIIVMVEPGVAFFALAFASFRIGAVMVAVDPGMGVRRVRRALAEVDAVCFVGNAKALLARNLFRWGEKTVRLTIAVTSKAGCTAAASIARARGLGGAESQFLTFDELVALGDAEQIRAPTAVADNDVAAILFTSGSTGPPKGVIYSHAKFEAQLDALRDVYGIVPGERELATFPLFALFAPALGMSAVIPKMDFTKPGSVDPLMLLNLVAHEQVTSMFGSPALLRRLVGEVSTRDPRLQSVRRAVSAGAPVPADVLRALRSAFDAQAAVHTPYGATEALPVASIDANEILESTNDATDRGAGVCVGRPCPGMTVKIIPTSDEPGGPAALAASLPTGQIGEITVHGRVVTESYYNNDKANALAKIHDGDGAVYHRMGDLGYLDELGRLWFCGRKSQRVPSPDGDLHTVAIEALFNVHESVARTALVQRAGRERAPEPVLIVELLARQPWETPHDRRMIRDELLATAARQPMTRSIRQVLFHSKFPVDPRHNAKIGREALSEWASRQRQ